MPVKRAPKPPAKKSRQEKLTVEGPSPQSPSQKDLELDLGDGGEEDFSELMRQDGDAVDEEGDPYDCGYVDTESNFEDLTAKQEKLTPAELAIFIYSEQSAAVRHSSISPPFLFPSLMPASGRHGY